MRVLLFCAPALTVPSGSVVRALLIASGLAAAGARVRVVSSAVPPRFDVPGITGSSPAPGESFHARVAAEAEDFRPDVLYGITESWADALADAAKAVRRPAVFDLHGIGLVEILELGAGHGPRGPRLANSWRWLSRIREADAVTVANPTLFPVVRRFVRRAVPLFGMTDVSLFNPDGPVARPEGDPSRLKVLYAGNYHKWQGVGLLVEAAARRLRAGSPVDLTLVGSVGSDPSRVAAWKAALPGGALRVLGAVDPVRIADHYRGADVIALPRPRMASTYLAFPQKLVDAMASARTVVATDLAPHRWALASPPCGILCPPTASGFAEGLRRAGAADLRATLGQEARRKAVEMFCHLRQCRKVAALFGEIAGRGA